MPIFVATFYYFFLNELHTNSPWMLLQVCKGMLLMSLVLPVSESFTFTTACRKGRSPGNFPNPIPRSRGQLFLSGPRGMFCLCQLRHLNKTLTFFISKELIVWFCRDLLDKAPDCSANLSFIPKSDVVASCSKSWEQPWPLCSAKHFETQW